MGCEKCKKWEAIAQDAMAALYSAHQEINDARANAAAVAVSLKRRLDHAEQDEPPSVDINDLAFTIEDCGDFDFKTE